MGKNKPNPSKAALRILSPSNFLTLGMTAKTWPSGEITGPPDTRVFIDERGKILHLAIPILNPTGFEQADVDLDPTLQVSPPQEFYVGDYYTNGILNTPPYIVLNGQMYTTGLVQVQLRDKSGVNILKQWDAAFQNFNDSVPLRISDIDNPRSYYSDPTPGARLDATWGIDGVTEVPFGDIPAGDYIITYIFGGIAFDQPVHYDGNVTVTPK